MPIGYGAPMKTLTALAFILLAATHVAHAAPTLTDASAARDALLSLVADRLERMPLVAAAKWRDGKAVSDPAREQALLDLILTERFQSSRLSSSLQELAAELQTTSQCFHEARRAAIDECPCDSV